MKDQGDVKLNLTVFNGDVEVTDGVEDFIFVFGHGCKTVVDISDDVNFIQRNGTLYHPSFQIPVGNATKVLSSKDEFCIELKEGRTNVFYCVEKGDEVAYLELQVIGM